MTDLLYLQNSYLFASNTIVLETGKNDFGNYIILDSTIFYPQGGGQPSDTGEIVCGDVIFHVTQCRLDEKGIVYHYGEHKSGTLFSKDCVTLSVHSEKRIINIRNHSAGHLLDIVIKELGYTGLIPTKGYHFPQGAYVEYKGNIDEEKDIFIKKVETKINELIEKDIPSSITYTGLGKLKAPTGKIPRYVYFEGFDGCGCGGTHVKKSGEIGRVSLRKVKHKKGMLKISYKVEN